MYKKENAWVMGYTEEINIADLGKFDNDFFASLVQTKIEKKLEIRSFFLIDTFYSMAIFSQTNPQTSTDFRKYDDSLPNRTVPFNLPGKIEKKLRRLLKKLQLNTASIDLLIDKKGDYIFLEVNPVGQFGMVSIPCNYHLEKRIALKLFKDGI
jgi:glutathione synthase/RimK-type ligase-like ATP-grasp enzyme